MATAKDNYIDPNVKARWGFGSASGQVTVGDKTVGETGGVDSVRTDATQDAARKNGSGAKAKNSDK